MPDKTQQNLSRLLYYASFNRDILKQVQKHANLASEFELVEATQLAVAAEDETFLDFAATKIFHFPPGLWRRGRLAKFLYPYRTGNAYQPTPLERLRAIRKDRNPLLFVKVGIHNAYGMRHLERRLKSEYKNNPDRDDYLPATCYADDVMILGGRLIRSLEDLDKAVKPDSFSDQSGAECQNSLADVRISIPTAGMAPITAIEVDWEMIVAELQTSRNRRDQRTAELVRVALIEGQFTKAAPGSRSVVCRDANCR